MRADPFYGTRDIEAAFSRLGGVFVTPAPQLAEKVAACRGIVLDWDGVFNDGVKGEASASPFSEADSMGLNLLRFALWRAHGALPVIAIITGEDNASAVRFAQREHFDAVFARVKRKTDALEALCAAHPLREDELIAMFDDVNDLGVAARCGVRLLVKRDASPLLREYAARNGLVDYVTGVGPREHAVREAAELLLGLTSAFDASVRSRIAWDDDYARYFEARQGIETRLERTP